MYKEILVFIAIGSLTVLCCQILLVFTFEGIFLESVEITQCVILSNGLFVAGEFMNNILIACCYIEFRICNVFDINYFLSIIKLSEMSDNELQD